FPTYTKKATCISYKSLLVVSSFKVLLFHGNFYHAILCPFSIFFSFLRIFPNLNALNVIWVYRIHIKTFIHNFPIYYYKRRKRGVLGPYSKDTFVLTWLFHF